MTNVNNLVLESIGEFQPFNINTETQEGAKRLSTMHIRPKGEWETHTQKPSNLFDANGDRIYGDNI